ncbi:MAG: hypothetical protein PQJ59_08050 [Spirochaetales bacterium]|nr:hypothetical protein [Spirochaetales bacterium]
MKEDKESARLGFKDMIALSAAIFRIVLPKLLITLAALWVTGLIFANILG